MKEKETPLFFPLQEVVSHTTASVFHCSFRMSLGVGIPTPSAGSSWDWEGTALAT